MHSSLHKQQKAQRGFTLFIAALVSSVLLALAIYMAGIAKKELVLTNLGRESQYAFYAADAGAECALFLDFKSRLDPTVAQGGTTPVTCANDPVVTINSSGVVSGTAGQYTVPWSTSSASPTKLRLRFTKAGKCVVIIIEKRDYNSDGQLDADGTVIESRGYNTACGVGSSRRLERGIRLQY